MPGQVARTRGSLGSGIVVVIFGTVSSLHSPDSRQLPLKKRHVRSRAVQHTVRLHYITRLRSCLGGGWTSKKAYQPIEDPYRHLSKSLGPRVHLLCRQLAPVHAI
ncbi:hypothetical protein BDZ85DRAFT_260562 [Elsinoe ampelina]|uniref:Uncharacterized protein n=1 Tax=Elsinoe ampelina TaxID=302913 RepID=A0A6A6GEW0_9PEZI|nr:hypothetical protein BDZ85DRAFT_260562 [Elsinoe ampelina]